MQIMDCDARSRSSRNGTQDLCWMPADRSRAAECVADGEDTREREHDLLDVRGGVDRGGGLWRVTLSVALQS